MTTGQLLIVCLTVLALAAVAAGVVVYRLQLLGAGGDELAPRRVGHRVTVHTKKPDDQTIFGVVAGDYTDRLVLEHAAYVTPVGTNPIPGARQDIATRDIAWIDVHDLVTTAAVPVAAGEVA